MRELFVLLRLFRQHMAERVPRRALLCKQQGEGEQQGKKK